MSGPRYPLGRSNLSEFRTSTPVAHGITYTRIHRGRQSERDGWTVDVAFKTNREDAWSIVKALRDSGYDSRVERVSARGYKDIEPGLLGFLVRVGKEATPAEATALRDQLVADGYTGLRIVYTGEDGKRTTGPWLVHVLELDPGRFFGAIAPQLGTEIVPGTELLTSIAARPNALAAITGGYFVIGPADGTPGDLAGISVIDGALVSEAVDGRTSLILPHSNGLGASIAGVASEQNVNAEDGAKREIDGLNRQPGLIRGCGGDGGDTPTEAPMHDFTCKDDSELILFTPNFGAMPGPGFEVALDAAGSVIEAREARGGSIPLQGAVLSGTTEAADWLRAHARVGSRLDIETTVQAEGELLTLGSGVGVVNGGPRLLRDGERDVTAAAEGFHLPERHERSIPRSLHRMRTVRYWARCLLCGVLAVGSVLSTSAIAGPRAVVISLDGATPGNIERFLDDGTLSKKRGLGLLIKRGVMAERNVTVTPSLTAPGHIAIATGSTAAKNDILANTFHLLASPFARNISGFSAPIGGYLFSPHGPEESPDPSAEPLWVALRAAGKKVVTATFPGGDGLDIRVPGLIDSPVIQPASLRTVDYTVPFGAFAGLGARGFELSVLDFGPAPQTTLDQLQAAGRTSFSPVQQKRTPLETFTVGGVNYDIRIATLDTSNDNAVNYDTLVFFDQPQGILAGPFSPPATGPAVVKADAGRSSLFYLEGSSNQAGAAFCVAHLASDLSSVRIARYAANFMPRNAPVLENVDDINSHVGFWAPQPDFRIPERLSPGFVDFPDLELEAIYQDQVRSFVDYQIRLALRSISQNPDADLVMIYIEQPDGSGHQFLITDPRQATNPLDASSIGPNQDRAKIRRYREYLRRAYQVADDAVQRIIEAVGQEPNGRPRSNIIVVSDHGFAPFHTAVSINNLLASDGLDPTKVRAITSGPAVNVYINLQGREPDGIVSREEYITLQDQIAGIFGQLTDSNPNYAKGDASALVFEMVYRRPLPTDIADPSFGLGTSEFIGQDGGDVFALLNIGYNFDGTQSPVVQRLGDPSVTTPVFSVPNFYGAHGYDPKRKSMSAIFIASGPDIRVRTIERARNIDIAPTVLKLLGVRGSDTIDGKPLPVLR